MSDFCRNLSFLKGLIAVEADAPIGFTPIAFCFHELFDCGFFTAVDTGHIFAFLSFQIVRSILHHIVDFMERGHSLIILFNGLFRIASIVDDRL
jgi:hypothetical protein